MGSLTSIGYTATQYALLSSFYALLGKFLKGFSGAAVEALQTGRELMDAYALFFAGTAIKSNFRVNLGHGDPARLFPRSPRLAFDEAARIV